MIIPARLQQSIFAALASTNRFAGSGGGSGLGSVAGGTAGAINLSVNITGTTYQTINTQTFALSVTANLLVWTSALTGNQTAGAGTCTMGVQLDGAFPSGTGTGLSLQGDIASNVGATTTIGPFTLLYVWLAVTPGAHTLTLVAKTSGGGVTYQCSGVPNFIILGAN